MKLKTLSVVAVLALASLGFGQAITEEAKATILAAVTKNVKERAYVGGVDFSKWDDFTTKYADDFKKADSHDSFALAVNEALDEFGFSHIQLLTPRSSQTRVTGKSVGIGVLIEPVKDGIRISRVIPGGPAEKAGLQAGDVIIKADGVPVKSADQVRGPKDTKVDITVRRGEKEEITVTITRAEFSVLLKDELKWLDDKTAFIQINSFATGYDRAQIDGFFKDAQKAQRLIIDLRSNGGGAVFNLSHLAGKVLPTDASLGKFVTRANANAFKKAHPDQKDDPIAVSKEFGTNILGSAKLDTPRFTGDLVVLISPGSASASEIFAAAIKDNHRGKIVGVKSAGAVLASSFMQLPEGFSLQIPLMEYVTPGGARLEGNGVTPDVAVPLAKVNDDAACIKAATESFDAMKKEASTQKPPPSR
jgi:carboxyl-terminal processing protease